MRKFPRITNDNQSTLNSTTSDISSVVVQSNTTTEQNVSQSPSQKKKRSIQEVDNNLGGYDETNEMDWDYEKRPICDFDRDWVEACRKVLDEGDKLFIGLTGTIFTLEDRKIANMEKTFYISKIFIKDGEVIPEFYQKGMETENEYFTGIIALFDAIKKYLDKKAKPNAFKSLFDIDLNMDKAKLQKFLYEQKTKIYHPKTYKYGGMPTKIMRMSLKRFLDAWKTFYAKDIGLNSSIQKHPFEEFEMRCKQDKDLEIRFQQFQQFQKMLENPDQSRQFKVFRDLYQPLFENGSIGILNWIIRNEEKVTRYDLKSLDKPLCHFLQQHPALLERDNLELVRFAMQIPPLSDPNILKSLSKIRDAKVLIQFQETEEENV